MASTTQPPLECLVFLFFYSFSGSASQSKIDEVVQAISYPIVEGEKLVTKITDSLSNVNVREFLGDKLSPVINTLKGTFGVLINSM